MMTTLIAPNQTSRSLPAKDAVLVTVGFLYERHMQGEHWDIWLGDGGSNSVTPRYGPWAPAEKFLPASDKWANLAEAPSALVIVARPTPKEWL